MDASDPTMKALIEALLNKMSGAEGASLMNSAVQQLGQLNRTLRTRSPNAIGSFSLTAAATFTIPDTTVQAGSFIAWTPTNTAAGTLEGSAKKLVLSTRSAGTSFTLVTASGGNAAGTETFSYAIFNSL